MRQLLAASLALALAPLADDDPAKAIRSKDVDERLAAVAALATGEHDGAEKLLVRALKDDDWEVVERAATALGTVGGAKAVKPLVDVALEGPVRRGRLAAAAALARLDAAEAFEQLEKKAPGKTGLAACEALGVVALALEERPGSRALEKALRAKEPAHRAAAARALVIAEGDDRAELLPELFGHEDLTVRTAALQGVAQRPAPGDAAPLLDALAAAPAEDVLARRARAALVALAAASPDAGALVQVIRARLDEEGGGPAARQLVRVLGELLVGGAPGVDAGSLRDDLLSLASGHEDPGVRAAAILAAGRGATGEGDLDRLRSIGAAERDAYARLIAVQVLGPRALAGDDATRAWLAVRLADDADPLVREEAAAKLGSRGDSERIDDLAEALGDSAWGVSVCAAVSLGKVGGEDVVAPLASLYAKSADWQRRGGAVVGLGRARQKAAVPILIDALDDAEPLVRRTAYEYLCGVARRRLAEDVETWTQWWAENEDRVRMVDPDEEAARAERFGYSEDFSTSARDLYAGLDVLVLESRGDHIQKLMTELEIDHRLTAASQVTADAAHSRCVFVANCTGEIEEDDAQRLAWFIRAGGYLFGSCWAVNETIARAYPGVIRRSDTRGEVLDRVEAEVCAPDSAYVRGVAAGGVVPIYELQGAWLIEVLRPERVEVVVDSPACAARWGNGNLAAWFTAGHGVVLDSANHFDVQGLELATDLKKPEERMAYAVDHMGLGYAELRAVREERWWRNNHDASQHVRDLSVFRLVTNFVREKRLLGD